MGRDEADKIYNSLKASFESRLGKKWTGTIIVSPGPSYLDRLYESSKTKVKWRRISMDRGTIDAYPFYVQLKDGTEFFINEDPSHPEYSATQEAAIKRLKELYGDHLEIVKIYSTKDIRSEDHFTNLLMGVDKHLFN
jgi:hypothetical protein